MENRWSRLPFVFLLIILFLIKTPTWVVSLLLAQYKFHDNVFPLWEETCMEQHMNVLFFPRLKDLRERHNTVASKAKPATKIDGALRCCPCPFCLGSSLHLSPSCSSIIVPNPPLLILRNSNTALLQVLYERCWGATKWRA